MKKILFLSFLLSCICITAQEGPDKSKDDINIEAFFEDQSDNTKISNMFEDEIKLRVIFKEPQKKYNTSNTVIHMDIDGVVINKSNWLVPSLLWQMKSNPISLIRALLKFKKGNDGSNAPYDKDGNPINGVTYQFLHCAQEDQALLPYIVNLINTIQSSRILNVGTQTILKYLKEKGYTIFFATNKDHYGYLKAVETLGEQFSSLADHVLCCEPGNTSQFMTCLKTFTQQNDLPHDVKNLCIQLYALQEDEKIHYVPWPKPCTQYWQKQKQITTHCFKKDNNPHILFFDDKQENVDGINNYQDKNMKGYLFTTPKKFAQCLATLRILDEKQDKELFDKL